MEEAKRWPGLSLGRRIAEGQRNEVRLATLDGQPVAVRRSRRSPESLAWELDLLHELSRRGFRVPLPIQADDGSWAVDGVVVQRWIEGAPPATEQQWQPVAVELQRLHATCDDIAQRPGCLTVTELGRDDRSVDADMSALPDEVVRLVLSVFRSLADVPVSLIHGDPGPSNVRIDERGRVGLLDWDESRVDLTWHDLSNLAVVVLDSASHERANRLSDAWEAINAWNVEPGYARSRLAGLRR